MKRHILLLLILIPLSILAQGKRSPVWVIDAGHGGHDCGTKGKHITEKEINLKVALEVARLIRKHKPGISVVTTRKSDKFVSLPERCRIANRAGADLFLSIHVNWVRKKNIAGTETFYAKMTGAMGKNRNAEKSELLARLLQNSYAAAGRPTYRGVRTNRLYVTANTHMPAALTEIGFISNASDAAYITTEKGMKEIATMIFNALMEYYATTQAGTQRKTLSTLRSTRDKRSGVKGALTLSVKSSGKVQIQPEDLADIDEPSGTMEVSEIAQATPAQPAQKVVEKVGNVDIISEDDIPAPSDATNKNAKMPVAPVDNATANDAPANNATANNATADDEPEDGPEEEIEPQAAPAAQLPEYSIQILTSPTALKPADSRLKKLAPVEFRKDGQIYRALYGTSTDLQKVRQTVKVVRKNFPDAFIIAHLDGKIIPTSEAIKITETNKKAAPAPAKKASTKTATTAKKAPAKTTTTTSTKGKTSTTAKKAPAKTTTTTSTKGKTTTTTKKAPAKTTAPAKKTTTTTKAKTTAPAKKATTTTKAKTTAPAKKAKTTTPAKKTTTTTKKPAATTQKKTTTAKKK